jgi:hypothetical protein
MTFVHALSPPAMMSFAKKYENATAALLWPIAQKRCGDTVTDMLHDSLRDLNQ